MSALHVFLLGALACGSFVAGLFFFRFWRLTRDRLFAIFGAAFFVLSLNRTLLALLPRVEEVRPYLYLVRLLAFALVLYAVIDKNRSRDA
jgi:hypothetical protein